MTWDEIEEPFSRTMNEQKGWIMAHLMDHVTPHILVVFFPLHVKNPMEHIQRHEASILARTNNDNHFTLLFPSTLGGIA